MSTLQTPEEIKSHAPKYSDKAWQQYTPDELGNWVHLLLKRAGHRTDRAKQAKDVEDAQNYLHMLQAHVDAAKAKLNQL